MTRPSADVLVAVPARDEAGAIQACLDSVVDAVRHALDAGAVDRVRVAVAAHRCVDTTAAVASRVLQASGLDHVVIPDDHSTTVGEVRTRLVETAVAAAPPVDQDRLWVLSTDADTVVPLDWVTGLLEAARRSGADLVAGIVALDDWAAGPLARNAYADRILSGLTADGHEHVWAANLAVRYRVLRAVGGFPAVAHGEERALADRVAAIGTVTGTLHPVVVTSARMPGRAAHGLGALLHDLARPAPYALPDRRISRRRSAGAGSCARGTPARPRRRGASGSGR